MPRTPSNSVPAKSASERTIAEYRAVLASALDPIITIDAHGVVQSASNSLERVFGWKPHEVIGQNVRLLMPDPHRSAHDTYLANYRRTHKTNILGRTREFHAVRKDGTEFPIELSVSRVDIPGESEPWFMGIIHDISERKVVEDELTKHRANLEEMVRRRTAELEASHNQLRQADRLASIGTLAAGLGHDMNNVLLPIRARLDALDAAELPPHANEQFQAVRRSVAYLQQLSDGLHLLALDPDDAEASAGRTNIVEWWKQVGPLLTKAVPKQIRFQVEFSQNLPDICLAPHRLTQAILNLVVNASEAIHHEGVVKFVARPAPSEFAVILSVSDTGHGMSPEVKEHALDPFFTTKKRGLGTGLGLSLVRGVTQAAGGSVEIQSQLGAGTTVTLTVPADRHANRSSRTNNGAQRVATVSIRDRRIASFVSAILQASGFAAELGTQSQAPHTPLWILEPGTVSPHIAREYLNLGRHRRIIFFGAADGEWAELGVSTIEDTTNLELIKQTLGLALQSIRSTTS